MLVKRLRRCPNIKTSLFQRDVFSGFDNHLACLALFTAAHVAVMSSTCCQEESRDLITWRDQVRANIALKCLHMRMAILREKEVKGSL